MAKNRTRNAEQIVSALAGKPRSGASSTDAPAALSEQAKAKQTSKPIGIATLEKVSKKKEKRSLPDQGASHVGVLESRQITLISKALADPTRMAVLRRIALQGEGSGKAGGTDGASCSSLKQCVSISAATLSHHMKELELAGLIETSRQGRTLHARLKRKVWKHYIAELKSFAA